MSTIPSGPWPFEAYLKLRMLATLVHEVAHHVDHRTRVARGRWRADDEEHVEGYAEEREREWVGEIVVPYLTRAHPRSVAALDAWMLEHAGAVLPLDVFDVDPLSVVFGLAGEVAEFVRDVCAGKPLDVARVELARELHHCERYDLAHRVLDAVLAGEPRHAGALVLRADIHVHEERFAEAEATARDVLARDARNARAWEVLCDVARERRDWTGVVEAASRGMEVSDPESWTWLSALDDRARGWLELGEHEKLAADVGGLLAAGDRRLRLRALGYRAISLLRTGRLAEALAAAEEGLIEARSADQRHELLAVRFEARRALDPSSPPDPLPPETLAALRRHGFDDWAGSMDLGAPPGP